MVYLVVAAGLALAFASALVPFYSAGYKLYYSVLLVGLLPYLVYGCAAPLLSRGLGGMVGILLVISHAWLVIGERFTGAVDYSDGLIYYVPALLAAVLSPLLLRALREPY
jgi:hypothetical protein